MHFYHTTSDMGNYAKWLGRLATRVDVMHERCYNQTDPKSRGILIALNLETQIEWQRRSRQKP